MEKPRYRIRVDVTIADENFAGGGTLRISQDTVAEIGGIDEAARLLTAVSNVLKTATTKP